MSEKIWEQMSSSETLGMHHGEGDWEVWRHDDGTVDVAVADCGCCGPIDVIKTQTVEEFDAEWERIGAMLREQVRRGLEK